MMYYSLWLACVGLLFLADVTSARESNAERLARGLTPLRPKFRSILPGFPPTRVASARRNVASPIPGQKNYCGRIEVRGSDGHVLGYVKNWAGVAPISGINFVPNQEDLRVEFNVPYDQNIPFDILATNPKFASPYYVGVSTGPQPVALQTGQVNSLSFTNVPQTPAGAPPMKTGDSYTESRIWTFNKYTKELKPQFINPDGSKPMTVIAYDIKFNQIFFVEDVAAWNRQHLEDPVSAVSFYLD